MAKSYLERVSTGNTSGKSTGGTGKMLKRAIKKNTASSGGKMLKKATPLVKGSAGKAPSMSAGNKSTIKKKIY